MARAWKERMGPMVVGWAGFEGDVRMTASWGLREWGGHWGVAGAGWVSADETGAVGVGVEEVGSGGADAGVWWVRVNAE